MHIRQRRFLTATTAVTLVSGLAAVGGAVVFAAPEAVALSPGARTRPSPVTITFGGLPGTVTAGGAPVEFTATLRNTADHRLDVPSSVFVVADAGAGAGQGHFRLEYRAPGGTRWQDARANAAGAGAAWALDQPAVLSLPAGAEAAYRLRLTVTADAPAGRVAPGFDSLVSDPALPPEQRTTEASGGHPDLVIVPAASPTTAPATAPATAPPTPAATAEVGLHGVPVVFTVGGEAKPFTLVLTNRSGRELRVVPAVAFQGATELPSGTVEFEFRGADGQWRGATPGRSPEHPDRLDFALRSGDGNAEAITLARGESRTVDLRLAFTRDAPILFESLMAVSRTLPEQGESAAEAVGPAADFITVVATGATAAPAPTFADSAPDPDVPERAAAPVLPVVRATGTSPSPAGAGPQVVTAAPPTGDGGLASTGGGRATEPMAITGATAIALGLGTLVVAWRRNRVRGGAGN
ncbi:hypothetical protein ACFU6K_26120 [Kitasatospora sp. NPDC057512]|uniref:hypothetical protein n=1 Tax=Kitasatospora sp. NPDC057512 TaxID=3346154 RepID=UPI0036A1052D